MNIATTRIIPMHITKGKTIAQSISDRTEYAMNPNKTNHGELISSYACDYRTLDSEFALSKREYRFYTGKDERNNVIAYQVRQSFKPGEVTPKLAHEIGKRLAEKIEKKFLVDERGLSFFKAVGHSEAKKDAREYGVFASDIKYITAKNI